MASPTRLHLLVLALVVTVLIPLIAVGADDKPAVSADEALKRLQDGNQRFVDGKATHPNSDAARRTETGKEGQHPIVAILGCSDSRVPLERVFDQGIGDIFAVRIAGNVAGIDELGSIEYGTGHLHTPLVVVLGHTKCGAVTAVLERATVSELVKPLAALIAPAVERAREKAPQAEGDALLRVALKENVWHSVADILVKSAEMRELAKGGHLKVVGAIYDVETGKVEWLGPHPEQDRLVKMPAKLGAKEAEGKESQPPNAPVESKK